MESDTDLVQRLLTLLLSTSTDAIAHLHSKPDSQISRISALRTDFLSLLSVLYSNTTKLSIALNPSSPVYSAAVTPLNDLITHSSTLASNASLFLPDVHGRTLTSEVHSTAKGVLTALQELAHAHLSLLAKPTTKHKIDTSRSSGNDDYLAKTGIVHELIRQAKAEQPHGLSKTNLIAVHKRWREHSEIIADAVSTLEVDASLPEDDEEEDELDDSWDDPELDLPDAGKQSPEQIQLAKKILIVAQRTSTLFDDVLSVLLAPSAQTPPPPPNALLDDLLDSAAPLVAAMDNLATQVYGTAEENPSHLSEARDEFARALVAVIAAVKNFWKGKEDPRPAKLKGSRAYFVEQFVQLNVAVESVQWVIPT